MSYQNAVKRFMKASGIRAIKTFCQTAVSLIGTNTLGVTQVDWVGVLSGASLAAVLSVLTSVSTGLPEAPMKEGDENG